MTGAKVGGWRPNGRLKRKPRRDDGSLAKDGRNGRRHI